MAALACASAHTRAHAGEPGVGPAGAVNDEVNAALAVYAQHGLILLPFRGLGQFFFLGSANADSTRVLFSVLFPGPPSDEITFDVTRDGAVVHRFRVHSAVSQQTITLAPGAYSLVLGADVWPVVVPRLGDPSLATPIPVLETNPLFALPAATAVVEHDSAVALYLEAYGADQSPVTVAVPGWTDTVALQRHDNVYSGVIPIPLSRLALGETTLTVTRGRDRVTTPVFVGFGSVVHAVSFDQLLGVLRYFAPADRLDSLRKAPLDERPRAWATFLARSREPLSEYLLRVGEANRRYRDELVPGWETDRGSVYLQLGDPDQVFVKPNVTIWLYTRYFGRLKFDHERLTPESREMLETLIARARSAQ